MARQTAHTALKAMCMSAAQRRNMDVTFHNHPVGQFIALRDFAMFRDAAMRGLPLPTIHPQTIGRKGELDTWGQIAGGPSFWMEVKGPGDTLSPEQIRECENLTKQRVRWYVAKCDTVDEFSAEAARFAEWVAKLPRG